MADQVNKQIEAAETEIAEVKAEIAEVKVEIKEVTEQLKRIVTWLEGSELRGEPRAELLEREKGLRAEVQRLGKEMERLGKEMERLGTKEHDLREEKKLLMAKQQPPGVVPLLFAFIVYALSCSTSPQTILLEEGICMHCLPTNSRFVCRRSRFECD